jgi:hypothetical protein
MFGGCQVQTCACLDGGEEARILTVGQLNPLDQLVALGRN